MGKYDVKVRYIFEGTYTVVAEDREEAESMVAEDCGLVLGGNIHTTRDDDEVTDWKGNPPCRCSETGSKNCEKTSSKRYGSCSMTMP